MQRPDHTTKFSKKCSTSFFAFLLASMFASIALVSFAQDALSAQVTLAWDHSSDAGVTGYNVYHRLSSGTYTQHDNAGYVTTHTVQDLSAATSYCFVATATTGSGAESGYSNEVCATTPASTNSPPVAANGALTILEDIAGSGTLSATDPNGNSMTYSVVGNGSKGNAVITNAANGAFTYTPNANQNGSDSFTFRASDGTANSNTATVAVTITPVNDTPVANARTLTTNEDTPVSGTVTATDVDGATLTYTRLTSPSKGLVTMATNGSFTYTPNANANGSDSFTFKANDGSLDSAAAAVTVTITPVNDTPVANAHTLTTNEDTPVSGTVTATDADGGTLTYTRVTDGSKGSVAIATNGSFSYTPNPNANGSDSFTFRASDGTANSNTATVSVTITPVNDAPVANARILTTSEATPVSGTVTATDVDGGTLTYARVTNPSKGLVTMAANGAFTYTPNANTNGSDSFTFKANDGSLDSAAAAVTVTITSINHSPVANALAITTNEDTPVSRTVTATDVDGATLTYTRLTSPSKGLVTMAANGAFTYTPNANANGSDSFTFKANDGSLDSAAATVTVTITPVNDTPVANALTITTNEATPVSGTVTATDVDGGTLSYSKVANPSKGLVTMANNGSFTYTPNANTNGSDSFTFKANDGSLDSAPAIVTVTITPVTHRPVAVNGTLVTMQNTAGTATLGATDPDGDKLTYSLVGNGTKGTVTFLNPATGAYIYSPNKDATGSDTFDFRASDGALDSNTATVSVSIAANPYTVYEDAEDANTKGWSLFDKTPSGAVIRNVYDTKRQSRVIELQGYGIKNGYRLRNANSSSWHNTSQPAIQWSMSYSEYFELYVDVNTSAGQRFLIYTPVDFDKPPTTGSVYCGLGTGAIPGQWHTFTRDLQADLERGQPGTTILEVNGIRIRGNLRLDNVQLLTQMPFLDTDEDGIADDLESNIYRTDPTNAYTSGSGINDGYKLDYYGSNWQADADGDGVMNLLDDDSDSDVITDGVELPLGFDPTNAQSTPAAAALTEVYENAEAGTITTGWDINAGASSETSITNVFDTDRQSRVIKLTGSGTQTSYRLQAYDSSGWHNSRHVAIAWNMKYSETFVVTVTVYTTAGNRTLTYSPVRSDRLGSSNVHHGLGTDAMNGQWQTFTRDLQADLEQAQPGVKILEVNNFRIRGSGLVDDIELGYGSTPN